MLFLFLERNKVHQHEGCTNLLASSLNLQFWMNGYWSDSDLSSWFMVFHSVWLSHGSWKSGLFNLDMKLAFWNFWGVLTPGFSPSLRLCKHSKLQRIHLPLKELDSSSAGWQVRHFDWGVSVHCCRKDLKRVSPGLWTTDYYSIYSI